MFPTFAASKADLVLNGILPIDQLKEWISPIQLLLQRVPVEMIEQVYGFKLAIKPQDADESTKPIGPSDLLSAHAISRGFRTSHGNPDESRSARIILKDYVSGRLLYCHPPTATGGAIDFEAETIAHQTARLPQRTKLFVDPRTQATLSMAAQMESEFMAAGKNGGFGSSGFQTRSVGARCPADTARSMVGGYAGGAAGKVPSSKKHYKGRK